jgi:hypothetical protein
MRRFFLGGSSEFKDAALRARKDAKNAKLLSGIPDKNLHAATLRIIE